MYNYLFWCKKKKTQKKQQGDERFMLLKEYFNNEFLRIDIFLV